MDNQSTSRIPQAACRNLRSKEMYYQGQGQADERFDGGVYWCVKTQEGCGPDGQPVTKTECCAGRSCYVG
jgi:hypothetical protein